MYSRASCIFSFDASLRCCALSFVRSFAALVVLPIFSPIRSRRVPVADSVSRSSSEASCLRRKTGSPGRPCRTSSFTALDVSRTVSAATRAAFPATFGSLYWT